MKIKNIDYIVFDVGGVLVELIGADILLQWTGSRFRNEAELYEAWICSPVVQQFERGHCSVEKFASSIIEELGLPVAENEFLDEFVSWPNGLLEGAVDMLHELKQHSPVACLSNTNEVHWMNQKDTGYLNRIFDRMFLSYRMGMVKPDLEIYHAMIKALDLPPSRILFLDDNQINVDAAIEAGITAHRVRGVSESRTLLESLKPGDVKN